MSTQFCANCAWPNATNIQTSTGVKLHTAVAMSPMMPVRSSLLDMMFTNRRALGPEIL